MMRLQMADCRLQIESRRICNPICNLQSEICNFDGFLRLLGLERGATLADIKRAYKRLARKFHPDINPGDRMAAAQFRQIAEAYETLSDPDRRRRYDTTGVDGAGGEAPTFGFEGFDFSVSVQRHRRADLRRSVRRRAAAARGAARRRRRERGADLHQTRHARLRRGDARRPADR